MKEFYYNLLCKYRKSFEESKIKNRVVYFDVLNILACISVIFLHCNGIVHTYSTMRAWKTSLIIEVICFWAVPVFLMLTGATLMKYRYKYDTKTFFKKRVLKIGIPFIFWAVIMIIWKSEINNLNIEEWSIKNILNIVFYNKEESTYYFMFVIIGIYLTLPILSILSEKKYRKILWYLVTVMFITKSFLPVILKFCGITYNSYLSILFDGYIIFVILGYLLSTMEIKKKQRIIIYILGIISCIFRYSVTYYLSTKDQKINKLLFEYTQFHSVLLAVAVFVFIKNINWNKIIKKEKIKNILAKVSGCSFGIYLMHKIIIHYELLLLGLNNYSIEWRIGGAILTYFICLLLVLILKKIPILRRIVP